MSAAGDELESGDSANALGDVYIGGIKVDMAFAAHAGSEIVAVDTGCNCIVLINAPEQSNSVTVNSWIETAATAGRLPIDGQGSIEDDGGLRTLDRHCSTASANLMPTHTITRTGAHIRIFHDVFKIANEW